VDVRSGQNEQSKKSKKMKLIKKEGIPLLIILIPFVFIALNYAAFPEQVPIHFGLDGEPNDYAPKSYGVFLLPGINLFVYLFFKLMPVIDPRKKSYEQFSDKFDIIRTLIHLLLSVLTILIGLYSLGEKINISSVMNYVLIIFFLVLGNYIGNVRTNYFIGIRVPWTLENEKVWTLTHRFAGKVWVITSLIMLGIFYFTSNNIIFPYYIGVIALAPIIYSYIKYNQLKKEIK
jgi:uncharacterized membrane protein